ncbi:Tfp pilus assembly protein FimT/FimU [Pectinatus frisingensis]|jgi:hypothetical protein|uniref:pilus assembly FimT family protein n=1 Tax=Pectinatus frisingensis TaxID=865 RepID=UPI0015F703FD|nr:hypothetical protein [Pectinatus frisingensis]
MRNSSAGFVSIELLATLLIIMLSFSLLLPKILSPEKTRVDFAAQYLVSNLRLIQQKSFMQPHETKNPFNSHIIINSQSYEIYMTSPNQPIIVKLPDGVTMLSNRGHVFSFNRGDNYTATTATITITSKNHTAKVIINSYGRIRMGD